VQHYRQRFTAMIDRTVGGVNKLSNQITSWLRRDTGDDDSADNTAPDDGAEAGDAD